MTSLLSYVPVLNRLVSSEERIDIEPVEVHDVEAAPEKRARTLKHLVKANHVNHSILYHDLEFDNHMAHALSTAYLLGAEAPHLHRIYEDVSAELEAWVDSPQEIVEDDWRDFLGDRRYQRAYVDFFEDRLSSRAYTYDWKKVVDQYIFQGSEPLVNGLIGGLGHPLIHLAFAFEMNSRDMATEALGLAATQYNYLHRYSDDASYTRPSPIPSASPAELLGRLARDKRFDGLFAEPTFGNIEVALSQHESLVLEYWNALEVDGRAAEQLEQAQEAAVALLVSTVPPGAHSYDFFFVHALTSSHAVRVLLPVIPARFHVGLVRQWWLLVLAVYIARLRPAMDPDFVPRNPGKGWAYVEAKALASEWSVDAHFLKAVRSIKEAAMTWGDVHERYLASAVRFVDDFRGWTI